MSRWAALTIGVISLFYGGCTVEPKSRGPEPLQAADRRVSVLADSYPVYYMASRIAGDWADVSLPVPRELDPAAWLPYPSALTEYRDASLILLNGAEYAKWVKSASLPQDRVVDTAAGFANEFIQRDGGETGADAVEPEQTQVGIDPYTWLDPTLAMRQADAVWEALVTRLPGKDDGLNANIETLKNGLRSLDSHLKVVSETLAGQPMLASHSVYNYLARRYAWNIESVTWAPDEAPDEAEWEAFDAVLKEHPAKIMLWEDEPHPATAALLAERGIHIVVFRPCANRPPMGDYMSEMNANMARLEVAAGR